MINTGTIIGKYIAAIENGIVVRIASPKSQDVPVILGSNLKTRVQEYLQEDDLVGIKYNIEMDDNFNVHLVADKLTFLSHKETGETLEGGDESGNI